MLASLLHTKTCCDRKKTYTGQVREDTDRTRYAGIALICQFLRFRAIGCAERQNEKSRGAGS